MFAVQSGDDLPGTRRLGDQGSAPEGDGGTHRQRQVGPPPPRGCAPGAGTDIYSLRQRERGRAFLRAAGGRLHQRAADGEGPDGAGHPPSGQPVCLVSRVCRL